MSSSVLHNLVFGSAVVMMAVSCARLGDEKRWDNPFDAGGSNWHPPRVLAPADTSVAYSDTVQLVASGHDENGTVEKFLWSFDKGKTWPIEGTPEHPARYVWGPDRIGGHTVWVKARDNDGVTSVPDSFAVSVHRYAPVVKAMNDTIVSQRAQVTARVAASDTNGPIVKYLWRTSVSGAWSDSTLEPSFSFSKPEGGGMNVVWAAYDRDGQLACDTFSILFNRGPSAVAMLLPRDGDTAVFNSYDFINETGNVRLRFAGTDPDSLADTLSYTLLIGDQGAQQQMVWSGKASETIVTDLIPKTRYGWKLRARDLFGDSIEATGSFFVPPSPSGPEGMVLIRSKEKTFTMGSPGGETYEQPLHTVSFTHHFWIDTSEVTRGAYASVMQMSLDNGTLPVTGVNWYDAVLYCNARSKKEGLDTVYAYKAISGTPGLLCTLEGVSWKPGVLGYRLPTEAEWEYATRATSQGPYFWGSDPNEIDQYAWHRDNSGGTVHAIAVKKANAFGMYDTYGNVWEWCNDWFGAEYYAQSPTVNPAGPESGQERVLRGGSYANSAYFSQSGVRSRIMPSRGDGTIGFRVVLQHP